MNGKTGGQKLRPRVALLGTFGSEDVKHFSRMFPTIWQAPNIDDLKAIVDIREIDLVVIAAGIAQASNWPAWTNVICFSKHINILPGPVPHSNVRITDNAETEEYLFPDVPLPFGRLRDIEYHDLTSVRGWPRIELDFPYSPVYSVPEAEREEATTIFENGAIICEHHTNAVLATVFRRKDTGLGVSCLPSIDKNQAAWVDLIVTQWAQSNREAFPTYGDWMGSPQWMVPEERHILSQTQALERKKSEYVTKINKQVDELMSEFALVKSNANKGVRRLITAQGAELVDEVAKALSKIGFSVDPIDKTLNKTDPKREDLRLNHIGKDGKEWHAIVEVRGYSKSGGTLRDFMRLDKFARLYRKETGQDPDKRIYIVNNQLDLLPPQRPEPLTGAIEDLEVIGETDGILIWSVDLFRVITQTDPKNYFTVLESIKHAHGRWIPPHFA